MKTMAQLKKDWEAEKYWEIYSKMSWIENKESLTLDEMGRYRKENYDLFILLSAYLNRCAKLEDLKADIGAQRHIDATERLLKFNHHRFISQNELTSVEKNDMDLFRMLVIYLY